MDARLTHAFLSRELPFDGQTLEATRNFDSSELLEILSTVLEWLRGQPPVPLYWLHDWSFHDSYTSDSELITLDALAEQFVSEEAMVAKLSDDDYVCSGVYPEDMRFFWRWGLTSDWDKPFSGSFDFTASPALLDELPLPPKFADLLTRSDSFFESSFAGQSW